VSFFSFYRALQLGPVAVVSPVFATYAAIAVLLSVLLHGERLSVMASTGVAFTIAGVALASGRGDADAAGVRSWGGIPFALVATFAWGVASYLVGRYAQQTGWFVPVLGTRLVEFVLVGGVLLVLRGRGAALVAPRGRTVTFPAVSAVSDAVAVSLFARGSEVGLVSVASAVSATFPLVVIAGGLILFHERPTPRQWLGVLAAITGLILLGLGR
jgi:drug/metabolite transporter (DMT)-like permease